MTERGSTKINKLPARVKLYLELIDPQRRRERKVRVTEYRAVIPAYFFGSLLWLIGIYHNIYGNKNKVVHLMGCTNSYTTPIPRSMIEFAGIVGPRSHKGFTSTLGSRPRVDWHPGTLLSVGQGLRLRLALLAWFGVYVVVGTLCLGLWLIGVLRRDGSSL